MSDTIVRGVDALMEAVLRSGNPPAPLYDMMAYHLGWADAEGVALPARQRTRFGGKKMRAVLCALACEAAGGKSRTAIPAAAAVELIQNFSLVHDDIEDGDRERRHRPTVWVQWGLAQAINAGSAMQALVNAAVLRTNAPADTVLDLLSALTCAMVEMTEGQHLDIAYQGRSDVTVAEYEDMASRKTGALMEAAAYAGARLATDNADALAQWRLFGRAFGQAFQAQDDLLGVVGLPALTGKPVGNDIRARKKALPLLHALSHSGPDDQALIQSALAENPVSDAAVARVTAIMERSGALDATRRTVDRATQAALAAFERAAPRGPAAAKIRDMALKSVGRQG
ncbi:MAG TPA: polyprenyl synthetase family protein [Armatimonadota bacterium]|jgi:geranylgeranyl diphosphate synthase type I